MAAENDIHPKEGREKNKTRETSYSQFSNGNREGSKIVVKLKESKRENVKAAVRNHTTGTGTGLCTVQVTEQSDRIRKWKTTLITIAVGKGSLLKQR